MTSGGKRLGAGRKALAPEDRRTAVKIYVSGETARALPELKARGIKIGDEVDRLVQMLTVSK